MNTNRFLVLFSLLIAANAVAYFSSCRQDEAATITPKTTGDMPASDRSCTDDTWCSYVIEAATNCSVVLCGDLAVFTGNCNFGCLSGGLVDRSITVSLTANTPYAFCVKDNGSVHVLNPPTATQAIDVTVEVAGTTGIPVTIPIGQSLPFSSDPNCSFTDDDCY